MERPRRNAARQCDSKVKKALKEELEADSMDEDREVVDLSSSSSDDETDKDPASLDAISRSREKTGSRGNRVHRLQSQSPLKPLTPQKTSIPTKQARKRARATVDEDEVEDESDSWCVSTDVQDISSSDDNCDGVEAANIGSRAAIRQLDIDPTDSVSSDLELELMDDDNSDFERDARVPRNSQQRYRHRDLDVTRDRKITRKGKGKGKGKGKRKGKSTALKPLDPLRWELLDEEYVDLLDHSEKNEIRKYSEDEATSSELDDSYQKSVEQHDALSELDVQDDSCSVPHHLPIEKREPPPELQVSLLPFQKEWLAWSLNQEASDLKGGILADEMGMGKTIQAISLIVAGRAVKEGQEPRNLVSKLPSCSKAATDSSSIPQQLPQVKATLVICPMVAVIQWRDEIAKFTVPGSVKVYVYHGKSKNITLAELAVYDVVLTTYSTLETEHRKYVRPPKESCELCGKQFYADRLAIHRRMFCGPTAKRTEKQSKQYKKLKGPQMPKKTVADVETEEESECRKGKGKAKAKGISANLRKIKTLQQELYEGADGKMPQKRGVQSELLKEALRNLLKTKTGTDSGCISNISISSILHAVKWQRIVLDEAHSIKDRRSSTAKATFALQSEYKWALSGTPLQNRVGELYSLVRFLGIYPFSYYFCRHCDCSELDFKFAGKKCECGHSPLHHFCWWNKFISNPIKRFGYGGEGSKAMKILRQIVLKRTLLRRTKLERSQDLALPYRNTYLRRDAFDDFEHDFYQSMYTQSQAQFNGYVAAGTLLNNYVHIFDLLTRLRQAVDHPYLVILSATANVDTPQIGRSSANMEGVLPTANVDPGTSSAIAECSTSRASAKCSTSKANVDCGLCHFPPEDACITSCCQHRFCKSCIQGYMETLPEGSSCKCPSCNGPLSVDFGGTDSAKPGFLVSSHKKSSILSRLSPQAPYKSSSKIQAVREEIQFMLDRDPAAKAIIFSQFTSMLDLIGYSLGQAGIKFVKLDGSLNMVARDQMIKSFTEDPEITIFLMSLKAGGVALNLTVASNVFLMDPWWNPAVEQQAQDRIHRIGQNKPIRITRFIIENTIEERILKLQEKKQLVFEGTVGGQSDALGKLTEEDLRFLFSN